MRVPCLFEVKEGKITAYKMIPDLTKITEFRKSEIEQNSADERFYEATGCGYNGKRLENAEIGEDYLWGTLNSKSIYFPKRDFHKISSVLENRKSNLLEQYYNGQFSGNPVIVVKECLKKEIIKYFLLTEKEYRNDSGLFKMSGIISISRQLYLLQLLEQGRFDLFLFAITPDYVPNSQILMSDFTPKEDVDNLLEMFNLEEYFNLSTELLEKLYASNLINGSFCCPNWHMDITTKILKMKKYN